MKTAFLLGREQKLSLAELGAFFGKDIIHDERLGIAMTEKPLPASPQDFLRRLGGTREILEIIGNDIRKSDIEMFLYDTIQRYAPAQGKILFAVNLLPKPRFSTLLRTLLSKLKKMLKAYGRSSAFVNKQFTNVDPVFVLKQNLIEKGVNIYLREQSKDTAWVGISRALQDIDSYGLRDYGKPCRDPVSGMLPPKLAQIMINLATSDPRYTIYDPFCGSGTILMEALLMGMDVIGSDKEEKNTNCSTQNITWLRQKFGLRDELHTDVFRHNAVEKQCFPLSIPSRIAIVTEPYLGPPLRRAPDAGNLQRIIKELSDLYLRFFEQCNEWLPAGSPIVFVFPVWKRGQNQPVRLAESLFAKLKWLGYSIEAFVPLQETSLFYDRPDQLVGREIVRFIKG